MNDDDKIVRIQKLPQLNIGSGQAPKSKEDGWVNCDLYPGPGIDIAFDACGKWPFANESIMHVQADHALEHFHDHFAFFRETWRVLIPNGQLTVRVPYGWHQSCWWDFTHLRPWLQESFATLQPGFTRFTRNHQHQRLGFAFWAVSVILILEKPWARMWRFKPLRMLVKWSGRHLLNVYKDLLLEAVKTTEDDQRSAAYGGPHHPAIVPCCIGVLEHEYYGESGEGLQVQKLLIFTDAKSIATNGF